MMDTVLQLFLTNVLHPFSGPSDGASVGCSRFLYQEKTWQGTTLLIHMCRPFIHAC